MTHFSFTFLAPFAVLIAASLSLGQGGARPGRYPLISEYSTLAAIGFSILGALQLLISGDAEFSFGTGFFSAGLRADAISVTLTVLVSFIGWVVMRYSRSYLDGERHEGQFHGLMLTSLATALIFVQAGGLFVLVLSTAIVGVVLKNLLLFYNERPGSKRVARKFAVVWHSADILLILAALLLYGAYGSAQIAELTALASAQPPAFEAKVSITLIVIAAALKTAAFPLHGWLTEVMEAPTPVSALLHAGIINSGGVMLITLSGIIQHSPGAMATLLIIGGFTALFGAAVMLTQSAVKTALAWSTISQMGFLLLQCGLGLWALALLHIIAHSLYKAHAFLSSGGAVKAVASLRRPGPVAAPDVSAVLKSFAMAILLFALIAVVFSALTGVKSAQAYALGGILIFGVAYLFAQGLADMAPRELTQRTLLTALAAAIGYFSFQAFAQFLWGAALPATPNPGPLEWALIVLAVGSFGLVAFAQSLFPLWAHHPATAGLRVHLANGLYLNTLLDRAFGGFRK